MMIKASDLPPYGWQVFIDGEQRTDIAKIAVGRIEDDMWWVSMTTDPDDMTYLTPPLEKEPDDE
jgi:hypothetical protein